MSLSTLAEYGRPAPAEIAFRWVLMAGVGFWGTLIVYGSVLEPLTHELWPSIAAAAAMSLWLELLCGIGAWAHGKRPWLLGLPTVIAFFVFGFDVYGGPNEFGRYWQPDIGMVYDLVWYSWAAEIARSLLRRKSSSA